MKIEKSTRPMWKDEEVFLILGSLWPSGQKRIALAFQPWQDCFLLSKHQISTTALFQERVKYREYFPLKN